MSRRIVHLSLWAGCLFLSAGCQPPPPGPSGPREEPTLTQQERKVREDRIREFFQARRNRFEVVATTVTESGQILDWIKRDSQIAGGEIAAAPEDSRSERPEEEPGAPEGGQPPTVEAAEQTAVTEVQRDPRARGPEGTVPVIRFDVENYLSSIEIPPEDPREVWSKVPPPTPPASNDRYYVVWQRRADTFYGTTGRINIWNTTGPVDNETSIAQVAVIRGSPMQAIEAGKIELQSLNGNKRPHFFVYYRTSGSASGDWVGGYNQLVDGWIQYSSTVSPGMTLVPWESAENGNQYSLDVQVRLWRGNWWVWAAGQWAGYYPQCKGGDAPPCDSGTLFSAEGIRDKANRLDWYGEVFDSSAPAATSTDMGSGDFAADGWRHAAYFRNLTYFWAPNTHWWWSGGSLTVTDSSCYSGTGPFTSNDANWRNWFFLGGPGKEASGCN